MMTAFIREALQSQQPSRGQSDYSYLLFLGSGHLRAMNNDQPPLAPYRDVDDTSRCEPFSLSVASAAADAFEASGLAAKWSAALSLPALGSPTMDPTPALELLTKRNALRNRNRDLSNLTAESPPPPRTKCRVHAPSLPVTSPHVMPATAPLLNLLLAAADTSEVSSSSSPDPPTD